MGRYKKYPVIIQLTVMNWKEFLKDVSTTVRETEVIQDEFAAQPPGWSGFTGTNDIDIMLAENRLIVALPLSYKEFLFNSKLVKRVTEQTFQSHTKYMSG